MAAVVEADDVLRHLRNYDGNVDIDQVNLYVNAATDHIGHHYGTLPSGEYTESLTVVDDMAGTYRYWLVPYHSPITTVTSITAEDGTEYTADFTISTDGRRIRHDSVTWGEWVVTYMAGHEVPADLKLAVLEDIRGLYQPGQIGPPAAFGAFDIDIDAEGGRPPVTQWPRIDAWIRARLGPVIA